MVLQPRLFWILKRRSKGSLPEASELEPKLRAAGASCVLPVCFWVHTRSPAHQVSCTSWGLSAVAQAVQIPKQTPEGSRRGLLDSLEHTDFSLLAARKPLWPLAGPGDVVLPPRLIWIRKRRDLSAPARGLRTGT